MYMIVVTFFLTTLVYGQGQGKFKRGEDTFKAINSTRFDFDETDINAQFKAPAGFFLQGRNKQSMSQLVRLREHFNDELKDSKQGIKAIK
jgi:hypothetical protein